MFVHLNIFRSCFLGPFTVCWMSTVRGAITCYWNWNLWVLCKLVDWVCHLVDFLRVIATNGLTLNGYSNISISQHVYCINVLLILISIMFVSSGVSLSALVISIALWVLSTFFSLSIVLIVFQYFFFYVQIYFNWFSLGCFMLFK